MERHIDLKKLTLDELAGVINLYPWFGSARKELAERLLSLGGPDAAEGAFAEAAMYVSSRRLLTKPFRAVSRQLYADKDIESLLRAYIAPAGDDALQQDKDWNDGGRKVYVVGGDYFSQSQYDEVKKSGDGIFSDFAAKSKSEMSAEELERHESMDIYTETLAQIYADQGYYEQAKNIYSKLILAYPEKNAYFAALIQKLEHGNQN